MRSILGTGIVAAGLLIGNAALGADIPVKGPRYTPAPYFSWTGFYVGGNVGYGWADGDGMITISGVSGPVSGSGNGFLGGAQAGYNWQIGPAVIGIEGDIQYNDAKGSFNGNAGANVFTSTSKVPWFSTLRGRLGYAFNKSLVYVTGGAVYGEGQIEGTSSVSGAFSVSKSFWTYTFGGGWEQALWGNWSAKVEYLYIGTPNTIPVPPGTTAITGTINTQVGRVGLNYKF